MTPSHRRDFLKTLLGGAAGLSLSTTVFGQGSATPITATKITDNFALISGAGSNVLVVSNSEGLLMVNGGLPEYSADLLKVVSTQGDARRGAGGLAVFIHENFASHRAGNHRELPGFHRGRNEDLAGAEVGSGNAAAPTLAAIVTGEAAIDGFG